ncbi:MAG: flagellar biosynthesis anti-sigma factor FlgM [Firmicutes bacterium]|jgi:flagellar biosynthesis anti-sigma factor FlgM|nr:flagellar biosynthesis anti-sigma factor FlgM [Bacillota bacterium]
MITPNKPIQQVSRIYEKTASARRVRKEELSVPSDAVRLSDEGREIQAVLQAVSSAPQIRPAAEEIRVEVQSGTYEVSSRQIAAAMLRRLGIR